MTACVAVNPLQVLLIEDTDADAQLIVRTIEQVDGGADVDVVSTRKEFAERLARHTYDLVLADYRLPNWTGMDALLELRRLGFDTPLILVTGALGDELAVECVKAGAADYVLKENLARLSIAAMRAVLDKRRRDESIKAQSDLKESSERFRKLAQASFDAILITQDGFVYDVNRGHADMFGYASVEEVIGRPITDFVAEESLADVQRRFVNNIEGTYQLVGLRKDGRRILLEATGATHVIGGRPARITALRDMTERRSLEDQFRQAQKMEAVGRLAGGVAHDFNNLLTVIMSYTDMLSEGLAAQDPRADDLDQIRKAAITATSLTRQLLAFSRHQVIEPRLVNLSDVVLMSNKMLNRLIGEDIDVVTTITKDPVAVMIDIGQLEQVIMNLAVNARDAMPRGGKLTLETAAVKIDADYARDQWLANSGRFAMLAVTDTGVGMDEPTLARIFEPFFTTKEVGKGTGLGLATVFGIIKQSNGFIRVSSEIGRGTTFRIYLPLVDKPTERYDGQPELVQLPVGTETVLLAEDAAAVRAAARQILERYGYTVLEAPSGSDALAIALKRQSPIHLLLTDVVMPEMSGRELAEQICELRPSVKVLYMSGHTDDAVVLHGILSAGIAYLEKPFSPATLARKVREVLDALPIAMTSHS
ncbi:MAG TPA: response regulator [Gemmatimonadaceae bacterium]|nr:response regulator [Gemmatimonadaceae bacterium]